MEITRLAKTTFNRDKAKRILLATFTPFGSLTSVEDPSALAESMLSADAFVEVVNQLRSATTSESSDVVIADKSFTLITPTSGTRIRVKHPDGGLSGWRIDVAFPTPSWSRAREIVCAGLRHEIHWEARIDAFRGDRFPELLSDIASHWADRDLTDVSDRVVSETKFIAEAAAAMCGQMGWPIRKAAIHN